MCPSDKGAKFLGNVLGDFLQVLAVFMNWCEVSSPDSLWWSLKIQWWGVGTLQSSETRSIDT